MISLVLKNHKNNNQILVNGPFGGSLKNVIEDFNGRNPNNQIKTLFNSLGVQIPTELWGMQVKEKMVLYTDAAK